MLFALPTTREIYQRYQSSVHPSGALSLNHYLRLQTLHCFKGSAITNVPYYRNAALRRGVAAPPNGSVLNRDR